MVLSSWVDQARREEEAEEDEEGICGKEGERRCRNR